MWLAYPLAQRWTERCPTVQESHKKVWKSSVRQGVEFFWGVGQKMPNDPTLGRLFLFVAVVFAVWPAIPLCRGRLRRVAGPHKDRVARSPL